MRLSSSPLTPYLYSPSFSLSLSLLPSSTPLFFTHAPSLSLLTGPTRNSNLKQTLLLANTVADARYRLYDDFAELRGRRLSDYVGAVRGAVLEGLAGGGADAFRVLA